MTIEIKTIKCPRLNKNYRETAAYDGNTPSLEVFVKFDPDRNPVGVMCNQYKDNQKSKLCKLNKKDCIYNSWKLLK